eukprot:6176311-Prymnesium_polylepis.1
MVLHFIRIQRRGGAFVPRRRPCHSLWRLRGAHEYPVRRLGPGCARLSEGAAGPRRWLVATSACHYFPVAGLSSKVLLLGGTLPGPEPRLSDSQLLDLMTSVRIPVRQIVSLLQRTILTGAPSVNPNLDRPFVTKFKFLGAQ